MRRTLGIVILGGTAVVVLGILVVHERDIIPLIGGAIAGIAVLSVKVLGEARG